MVKAFKGREREMERGWKKEDEKCWRSLIESLNNSWKHETRKRGIKQSNNRIFPCCYFSHFYFGFLSFAFVCGINREQFPKQIIGVPFLFSDRLMMLYDHCATFFLPSLRVTLRGFNNWVCRWRWTEFFFMANICSFLL